MSSLIRRIQRQLSPSQKVHPAFDREGKFTGYEDSDPRRVFYGGRGSRLGTKNSKDASLLARRRREIALTTHSGSRLS